MTDLGSMTRQVQQLRSPEAAERDAAAQLIWERYSAELLRVAAAKLFDGVRAREDEHDVVQDAFGSFCRRQRRGDFLLDSRNALIRLLITITARKAYNANHHHQAQERDYRHEQPSPKAGLDAEPPLWLVERMDKSQPTPLEAAIFREEFDRHMIMLPVDVRRVVELCWIEGCTQKEAGARLGSSVRSVARRLELAREIWRNSREKES